MKEELLDKMFWIAHTVAISSEGTGKRNSYRLGAVLFDKNGKIFAAKTNSKKTHPALSRYTDYPYQHAETACILGHGMDNCEGLNLIVVRVLKDDSLALSRPCEVCQAVIARAGINEVYYTQDDGRIGCMT
ncbi:MAG: hypothetical protein ACPHEP_05330 [Acidimicrobiales bacterium]